MPKIVDPIAALRDAGLSSAADFLDELAFRVERVEGEQHKKRRDELEQRLGRPIVARRGRMPQTPTAPQESQVANTLGGTQPFIGQANLLADPNFDEFFAGSTSVATTESVFGGVDAWYAIKSATSCTATMGAEYDRFDPQDNPFNSGAVRMRLVPSGSGTHTLQLRSGGWTKVNIPVLPYLIGAIRVARLFASTETNVTSSTLVLELYDATAAVVRGTTSFDLAALPNNEQVQLSVAIEFEGQAYADNEIQLRARLEVESTGSGGDIYIHVGEPQLHLSYTQDPISYTPALAQWKPNRLVAVYRDSSDQIVGVYTSGGGTPAFEVLGDGSVLWGASAGLNPDVRFQRSDFGELVLDTNGEDWPVDLLVEAISGQRAVIGLAVAGDSVDRAALEGDASDTGLFLGDGTAYDVGLRRTGAGAAQVDDGAGGDVSLNVKGTFTVNGSTVGGSDPSSGLARQSSAVTLTTSEQDVPGCSLSLGAGTWEITGIFDLHVSPAGSAEGHGLLNVAGVTQSHYAFFQSVDGRGRATVTQKWKVTLGGTSTVKLRVQATSTSGTIACETESTITAIPVTA